MDEYVSYDTIESPIKNNDTTMSKFSRIDRKLEHTGKIVNFYSDTMELPDGKTAIWDFIEHKGAAAIVPVDKDGKIIMVRQYRNAIERYTLEIPAGGLNKDEDMKVAAIRELEEETGYHTEDAQLLIDLYTTVAFCNERIKIYVTEELTKTRRHLDEDEFVDVERHDLEELVKMIFAGEIMDSKTIAGILAYKAKKDEKLKVKE